MKDLETLVWTPEHGLTDKQIDQFLVISRSVGTFGKLPYCFIYRISKSIH